MKYLVLGLTLVALTLTAFIIGLSKDPRKIPSNLINSVIPNFDLDYIGGGINHFTKEDLLKLLRALFSRNLSGGFALSLVPILRGFEGSDVLNTLLEEPTETYSWVCQVALAHPHRTP